MLDKVFVSQNVIEVGVIVPVGVSVEVDVGVRVEVIVTVGVEVLDYGINHYFIPK